MCATTRKRANNYHQQDYKTVSSQAFLTTDQCFYFKIPREPMKIRVGQNEMMWLTVIDCDRFRQKINKTWISEKLISFVHERCTVLENTGSWQSNHDESSKKQFQFLGKWQRFQKVYRFSTQENKHTFECAQNFTLDDPLTPYGCLVLDPVKFWWSNHMYRFRSNLPTKKMFFFKSPCKWNVSYIFFNVIFPLDHDFMF